MIPLLAFYMYLAWKQAHANDVLIEQLAGMRRWPKRIIARRGRSSPGGQRSARLAVLLRVEFLAAVIVTNHPDGLVHHSECAAGKNLRTQPDHEPGEGAVVFPRLAEMLVYFDP